MCAAINSCTTLCDLSTNEYPVVSAADVPLESTSLGDEDGASGDAGDIRVISVSKSHEPVYI